MTIDTACSGSLISVDLACRYLDTGDADGAIVAGCNLYMSPEHNMDQHAMTSAASPSGRCWTFDARADGYIKAEATNCLILKRLDDAVRDGDPIRAVIRGTSTNSDGWTPGIASPSADAQAVAIRRAYARAGINDLGATAYLECHGTGTLAGDPIECRAASSVFSKARSEGAPPLRIGSVKSNIGHSEPAAGISGMLKTILTVERGIIPGNPTFEIPNPNIDFEGFGIKASKAATPWPMGMMRRASVNSFGYGGSNAHAIVEHPSVLIPGYESRLVTSYSSTEDDLFADEDEDTSRRLLVFSANDETSLKAYVNGMVRHLANPAVKVDSGDLAYTLARHRTQHFHRGYAVADGPTLRESQVVYGKRGPSPPIGFVFTGQGAQWPQMGRELLDKFPVARDTIKKLDQTLQLLPQGIAPLWTLEGELTQSRTAEHMRLPEFSQPLVTALQLALLSVLTSWGLKADSVVGHSSGEIAAAVASGHLSPEDGIKAAYFRGKAASDLQEQTTQNGKLGMLAVGIGADDCKKYLDSRPNVRVACRNSPKSATLAGRAEDLQQLEADIKADGHFARLLLVDLAYHSEYMTEISQHYRTLLETHCPGLKSSTKSSEIRFFSTVYSELREQSTDVDYWVSNMMSPVLFDQGLSSLVRDSGAGYLIELGPSGALAGPIKQILQSLDMPTPITYSETLHRGQDSIRSLYDLAGKLFLAGVEVDLLKVNGINQTKPKIVIDLPNYQWNHSIKYWHESLTSKDWRYRPFPIHDLLGTKILGTSWNSPSWRRTLRLKNVPWIRDHTLGTDVVFPASAYVAMAVEAVFQMAKASGAYESLAGIENVRQASYRMRDVRLLRALVVAEDAGEQVYCFLNPAHGQKNTWYTFKISSLKDESWTEHCTGMIRIDPRKAKNENVAPPQPLKYPTPARLWYKSMQSVGFNFGPTFQNLAQVESVAGQRTSRARINFPERTEKESPYAIHPSVFDTFFQAGIPSLYQGDRTKIQSALVPQLIDEILINPTDEVVKGALADTNSVFTTGRPDKVQNYVSNVTVHNETGGVLAKVQGLHYTTLDIPDAALKKSSMCPMRVSWEPDISLLDTESFAHDLEVSQEQSTETLASGLRLPRSAARLVSLLKHKVSVPSVLDLDMTVEGQEMVSEEADGDALSAQLSTFGRYVSASTTVEHMMDVQNRLQVIPGTEFHIYDASSATSQVPFDTEAKFDLVLLRTPPGEEDAILNAISKAKELVAEDGYMVLIHDRNFAEGSDSGSESGTAIISWKNADPIKALGEAGLEVKAEFTPDSADSGTSTTVYLCAPLIAKAAASPKFSIVTLSSEASRHSTSLIQSLKKSGWTGETVNVSAIATQPQDLPLLFVDDPNSPLLANMSETTWNSLRKLITSGRDILWLTTGSQMTTPSPSNALIHGFARSLRGEDSTLSLVTLDVSSLENASIVAHSVLQVMATFSQQGISSSRPRENEYAERGGVLHVSRVLRDEGLVQTLEENSTRTELRDTYLRANPRVVRLHCERVGAMDSIYFNEIPDHEIAPLGAGEVEVEIRAAGLNYKDIATSLGLVPENEYLLGLEGAGVIKQVGSRVKDYRAGDRVLVHGKGSFSNRIRVPEENVFSLPEKVSFKEAATMSIVYFTAVYSLMEIARVKKGQSVLIHSAAGGVGLASLQVCKYLGAKVYATAGSEKKRKYLSEHHGIPAEHIFSSRDAGFASGIRDLTGGEGVDVVLNFLTGDLLDDSWRLLADNGTLLEIGKKDIVDRNTLSMEPFDRNCSYRGIDISKPSILDDLPLVKRILQTVRQLLVAGHISPINPMTVFSFSQIPDAMRYMRSGEHMGKIVISDNADVQVPIRAARNTLSLNPEAAYLVVGGLKGLCGSLAVSLARSGARHLIIMSRSGGDDERSQRVIRDLEALGAQVQIAKGDVSDLDDTRRVFKESSRPIKGVIQGAMVLRVSAPGLPKDSIHANISCRTKPSRQ